MHLRELPENAVRKVGVFVDASKVGEMVQTFLDDPDVLGIESIQPGLSVNKAWYIVVKYGVLSVEEYQRDIAQRLSSLTGNSPTFRSIQD